VLAHYVRLCWFVSNKLETLANVNVNKLKATIKPLTIPFTGYESEMQDKPEQGIKSFDPDCY